jgi:seryl-tRNA synthetase
MSKLAITGHYTRAFPPAQLNPAFIDGFQNPVLECAIMIDSRLIKERPEELRQMLGSRGAHIDWDSLLKLDRERRTLLTKVEELRAQRRRASEEIAKLKREQRTADALVEEMRALGDRIKILEDSLHESEEQFNAITLGIPNLPHASVPLGKDSSDNVEIRRWGEPPAMAFAPKPHWELGERLGILDFERAARMTGARFAVYSGAGAHMERALINFMLDLHTREHGYREVLPPFLVNRASMIATGQLPKFEEDLFRLKDEDYFLIPTAEVPLTNLHREETLSQQTLPLRYAAYTPCFRREAGSYGKDTRGLIRQHQFNKVELVTFSAPEISYDELEQLTSHAEEVLRRLNLHYRIVSLCTADLGFAAAKTYDIEVWLPSQGVFREVSSCSNFETFQARRAEIRYKRQDGKSELVHTLNGSGLAVGRTFVAILENYQQADGSVVIPDALRPYLGGLERIQK